MDDINKETFNGVIKRIKERDKLQKGFYINQADILRLIEANRMQGIDEHALVYGDTWETEPPGYLQNRVKQKLSEFELTGNPAKLVSLANLTMLLFLKMEMRRK